MPEEELKTSAASVIKSFLAKPHDQDIILLVGAGNHELINGLRAELNSQQTLIVLDPSLDENKQPVDTELVLYCYGKDFRIFSQKCRQVLGNYFLPRFMVLQEEASDNYKEQYYQEVSKAASQEIRRQIGAKKFESFVSHIDSRHFMLNMPMMFLQAGVKQLKGFSKGETAVVVGAGPSLAEHIDWLKAHRNKFVLVAAGSTVKAFEKYDFEPDLYVEMDLRSADHWQADKIYDVPLVLPPYVSAGMTAQFPNTYWCESLKKYSWQDGYIKKLNNDIEALPFYASTGCAAAAVAAYLGVKRVLLIGIDLCLTPEGGTHSHLHTHGKDVLCAETDNKANMVLNNKGEKCRTIFQGFINGFEKTFEVFPEVEFIQTSESGVCFKNATFQLIDDVKLPEKDRREIPKVGFEPFAIAEFKQCCKEILHSVNQYNVFDDIDQNYKNVDLVAKHLHKLSKISALNKSARMNTPDLWRELIDYEFSRNKSCIKNDIRKALNIVNYIAQHETRDHEFYKGLTELYRKEYPVITADADLEFELQLLQGIDPELHEKLNLYYQQYPVENPEAPYIAAWQRTNMAQLRLKGDDGQYQTTVGFYDLVNYAQSVLLEFFNQLYEGKKVPQAIIYAGVFDGNYLEIVNDKLKKFSTILVEPDFTLFAEVLRICPVISFLGNKATYIVGKDIDSIKDELLSQLDEKKFYPIFCADKAGKYLEYYKELYDRLTR